MPEFPTGPHYRETVATALDAEITSLAEKIAGGARRRSRLFHVSWWNERLLDRAMANPGFKTDLFRFVDVFPATRDNDDVLGHLGEYLTDEHSPGIIRHGLRLAGRLPGAGAPVAASVARRGIARVAGRFVVGSSAVEARDALRRLWGDGFAATVDLLGEKTVTEAEADRYAARVTEIMRVLVDDAPRWPARPVLEADDHGGLARVNVSIKPTALAPSYGPLTRDAGLDQAKSRLRPLLALAAERGAFVNVDMEHADVKDLTFQLVRDLLDEPAFAGLEIGVVVQAYLRDSYRDLTDLIAWSSRRRGPLTVRLVKGAYWDTETVTAAAAGWPSPVYANKHETDANYERCTRLLHDHHGEVKAAFGSHNLRSIAHAVTYARSLGIADNGYEVQMLAGMAEPIQAAIAGMGMRLRVYAPVGDLVPGMGYLVRRLLENTSNESFVRHRFAEGRALGGLLVPPVADLHRVDATPEEALVRRHPTDVDEPGPYVPEPAAQWRRAPVRAGFGAAIDQAVERLGVPVPAVIAGRRVHTPSTLVSVDPADPSVTVAESAACGVREADDAVGSAVRAWGRWSATTVAERAGVLFAAAAWLRERRHQVAALIVIEVGKPWAEADVEVCEAIDFCEYYGRRMLRLEAGGVVDSPPGEANALRYRSRGVVAVIAPWNFPLAIPCGMVTAALVAGNAVVLKPAEQSPAVAAMLVKALEVAGLPPGVLNFLPGRGEEVGARLVEHPDVAVVAFTGSKAVGLAINETAAVHRPGQAQVKRVIAEMGGKNAIIVDTDADLDQAVPAVVASAFGYAGQKCSAASRLIVVDPLHDEVVERVVGATRLMQIGHPRHMGTQVGPLIDADALERVHGYQRLARKEGTVALQRDDLPERGWFVGPTVVVDIEPQARLVNEEIFGPVLTVSPAADLDEAIALANGTDYALTAGLFSRSPACITRCSEELRAGNVYINRGITGAVVGRQPFGGYGLSGVGSKAGGPDYLLQFLDPRVVTENTLRQGFVPDL